MADEEKLDEKKAIECLNEALVNQYRSALQYSIAAASLLGIEAQSVGEKLTEYGDEELADARLLIEKIVSFGGEPTTEVAALRYHKKAAGRARLADPLRGGGRREAAGGDRADRARGPLRGAGAHARAPDHAQAAPDRLPQARDRLRNPHRYRANPRHLCAYTFVVGRDPQGMDQ